MKYLSAIKYLLAAWWRSTMPNCHSCDHGKIRFSHEFCHHRTGNLYVYMNMYKCDICDKEYI